VLIYTCDVRFRVTCDASTAAKVGEVTPGAVEAFAAWAGPWRGWIETAGKPSLTDERLAIYRAERDRLVAAGDLAASRADVLRHALSAHITEQGWRDKRWRPIPPGEHGPGRRWGTRHQQFDATVTVEAPEAEGELVRRVAYWSSAKPTRELRAWTDRHGRGPAAGADPPAAGGDPAAAARVANRASRRALAERDELRAQILTVGDILRDVLARAATYGYTVPDSTPPR
jgi:hypothetical protein